MTKKWIAKRIYVDGVISDYEVRGTTDSNQKPSAQYDILQGPDIPRAYAVAIKDPDGDWHIGIDLVKQTAHDTKVLNKQDAIDKLKSIDWDNVTSIVHIKQVMKHMVTVFDME